MRKQQLNEVRYYIHNVILISFPSGIFTVGRVAKWLKRRAGDRHGFRSKATRAILLCSWETYFMLCHFPAWRSWQAVLNYSFMYIKVKTKLKNFNRTAIFWHLRKQVGIIAFLVYSAADAFVRVGRINTEIK